MTPIFVTKLIHYHTKSHLSLKLPIRLAISKAEDPFFALSVTLAPFSARSLATLCCLWWTACMNAVQP